MLKCLSNILRYELCNIKKHKIPHKFIALVLYIAYFHVVVNEVFSVVNCKLRLAPTAKKMNNLKKHYNTAKMIIYAVPLSYTSCDLILNVIKHTHL